MKIIFKSYKDLKTLLLFLFVRFKTNKLSLLRIHHNILFKFQKYKLKMCQYTVNCSNFTIFL
jgi:hypothetical protein